MVKQITLEDARNLARKMDLRYKRGFTDAANIIIAYLLEEGWDQASLEARLQELEDWAYGIDTAGADPPEPFNRLPRTR